jgi:hypothetical protein
MPDDFIDDFERPQGVLDPSPAPTVSDLDEEWQRVRGVPEYLYVARAGFSFDDMHVEKVRIFGVRKVRGRWHYLYQHEAYVYKGPRYKPSPSKDLQQRYIGEVKSFVPTIEEALIQVEAFRQRHIESMENHLAYTRQQIAKRLQVVADCEERLRQSRIIRREDLLTDKDAP